MFAGIAREAQRSPLRVTLLAQACGELRIAGNRLFDIGPPKFTGATVAIAVDAGGRQLALDGNAVTRVDAGSDDLEVSR